MDSAYRASVTDNPTYVLSIAIGGRTKEVEDYVGAWEGMPAVVSELEEEVDKLARTERWISGADGLVPALRKEKFNFHTFEAQVMLKQAASRGETSTVQALVDAGVPLDPLPAPKPADPEMAVPFEHVGWLTAAGNHPETMRVLIAAAARKSDQNDKDLGLLGAARSGNVAGARALIAYGANPNADLSNSVVTEGSAGMILEKQGPGSVLIAAAESGNPEMVREILRYHPKIEARDYQGKTAIFAAGEYRDGDEDGTRAECVKLLGAAGANINARDAEGNTPLHETFLMEVAEELLKLGADVNARNDDGETPVLTNVGDDVVRLLIEHGADLTIRNNKGETVVEEAAKHKGPSRQEALKTAILQRDRP